MAGSFNAQQEFPLSERLKGNLGFTVIYVGNRPGEFQNNDAGATRPRILMPSYTTLDLRGGLVYDEDWSLSLYVRNVTDSRGISIADNRNGTAVPTALYIVPRTFGVTVARNF